MNEIDPSKYQSIINRNRKKEVKKHHYFKVLLIRIMIVIILFLSLAIGYRSSYKFKEYVDKYLYSESIHFTKIRSFYNKYLGGILPKLKSNDTTMVFNENINYKNKEDYYDGVKLEVDDFYLVPSLCEGMVIFIGYKEKYGNTIIVEDVDGVYYWYGNISNTSVKIYDYIEKGSYIGEANNELYLVFSKDDMFLDDKEYLK